jgi:hypothetical protein
MLGVTVPGDEHHFETAPDGKRTAWLAHPDGSWAGATAIGQESPLCGRKAPGACGTSPTKSVTLG